MDIDIKTEWGQNRALKDAAFLTMRSVIPSTTCGEDETATVDKLLLS